MSFLLLEVRFHFRDILLVPYKNSNILNNSEKNPFELVQQNRLHFESRSVIDNCDRRGRSILFLELPKCAACVVRSHRSRFNAACCSVSAVFAGFTITKLVSSQHRYLKLLLSDSKIVGLLSSSQASTSSSSRSDAEFESRSPHIHCSCGHPERFPAPMLVPLSVPSLCPRLPPRSHQTLWPAVSAERYCPHFERLSRLSPLTFPIVPGRSFTLIRVPASKFSPLSQINVFSEYVERFITAWGTPEEKRSMSWRNTALER